MQKEKTHNGMSGYIALPFMVALQILFPVIIFKGLTIPAEPMLVIGGDWINNHMNPVINSISTNHSSMWGAVWQKHKLVTSANIYRIEQWFASLVTAYIFDTMLSAPVQ